MSDVCDLTLLIGPQTRVAHDLNTVVRQQSKALKQGGLFARPSRVSMPLLRQAMTMGSPLDERREVFFDQITDRAFLSAVNFMGGPNDGLAQRELFPELEATLARFGKVTQKVHIILAPDRLPDFFLTAATGPLLRRVRATPWEALFELGWFDIVDEILMALPNCHLTILTPKGAAMRSCETLELAFGDAAKHLPDPHVLLRAALNETGKAVLDRMLSADAPAPPQALSELYDSFAATPEPGILQEQLGIDPLTAILLNQRFDEDIQGIGAMSGVTVI